MGRPRKRKYVERGIGPVTQLASKDHRGIAGMPSVENPESFDPAVEESNNQSHQQISEPRPNKASDEIRDLGSQPSCQCTSLVQNYLTTRTEDVVETTNSIAEVRQAIELARGVLFCNICGNVKLGPPKLVGNVLLLGALLLSILSSYNDHISENRERALMTPQDDSAFKVALPHDMEGFGIEIPLNNVEYWRLLKKSLATDMEEISSLCDSFAARQHAIHDHGHERCERGFPCRRKGMTPDAEHPASICPRLINQKTFFSCFRTIDHIRSAIEEAHSQLALDISEF